MVSTGSHLVTCVQVWSCSGPPGRQHLGLLFEFWQRPVGGFLGIQFGSWKCVCVWMFSPWEPVLGVASEKCHACFRGGTCHLCARTSGDLPTFLGVTPRWAGCSARPLSRWGLNLTVFEKRRHSTCSRLHFDSCDIPAVQPSVNSVIRKSVDHF